MAVIRVTASVVPPSFGLIGALALGGVGGAVAGAFVALAIWPALKRHQMGGIRQFVE